MFKHGRKILLGAGVLAALSFGGSALSAAGAAPVTPVVQHSSSADNDQIQSGDQSTPDVGAEAPGTETADAAQASKDAETMDGAQGTQDWSQGSADSETQDGPNGESGSEAASNDGPGGHADEPANPNANHQAGGATQE
jgi:fibronectin-binding autotransporter adhesin